jgi:class 3 adenylate cyclase
VNERPVTRYAKTPDGVSIAYQVIGDGPLDLLFPTELGIPIDLLWEDPGFVRVAKRLQSFSRTTLCEVRGIGASGGDYLDSVAEEIADADLAAVLDAAECGRVALVGTTNSGPLVIQYAIRHPERIAALVLINTYAHYVQEDDYPWGVPLAVLDRHRARVTEIWGSRSAVTLVAPSKTDDERFHLWWERCQRLGVGPDQGVIVARAAYLRDVRSLLPTLTIPTLVLHREGSRYIQVGAGRYVAEHIPGAKYVELSGDDQLFFASDTDALIDEVEEFLTGSRQPPEGEVVTATILFTDIVASTEQSARLGHRRWTTLTDAHDTMVRASLARHRGHEVRTTGDGFLATFDATTRAVRAASEIVTAAKGVGLEVRAGVHTGEVEVRPDDVVGLPVAIAKRICDLAGPAEVLVSESVKSLIVGSGIHTSKQGTHVLKGVPEEWRLFAVRD